MLTTTEQTPLTVVEVVPSDSPDDADVLAKLPPMPTVSSRQKLMESIGGFVVVTMVIGWVIGLFHLVILRNLHGAAADYLAWFFYSCAVAAMTLLSGIYLCDPGVIVRSPETCLPLPEEVASRLAAGQSLEGLGNIEADGDSGEALTYCVRCCVWRPKKSHHCSTCQRCVVLFDHHCGVFGRCIAGDPLTLIRRWRNENTVPVLCSFRPSNWKLGFYAPKGNMWMFVLILAVGALSTTVCYLTLFLTLFLF